MKRQRGRNRSGNTGSGGGKPQQNANRAFDSTGPENIKVRGHAQHVFEKYQQLARDATSSGDRVLAENFLQHAEHYFRVLRTIQPNRPVSDFVARDTYGSNYDIDFEDESGAQADPEPQPSEGQQDGESASSERSDYQGQPRENRDNQNRDQGQYRDQNQNRNDQNRNDQNRGERQQRNRYEGQNDRNQGDRNQNDRNRGDFRRDERAPRTEGGDTTEVREDRNVQREPRSDRGGDRSEGRRERSYEPRGERSDPLAVIEPRASPLVRATSEVSEPVREDTGGVLRSQDGSVSHAPAFLQASPAAASDDTPVKRPRGRPRKTPATDAPASDDA